MLPVTPKSVSREWIRAHVHWLWGWDLMGFQEDILVDLLNGGIYSVLLPTDHSKSAMIEIATVLGLIKNPVSRWLLVKLNDNAAKEVAEEVYWRLEKASERYPLVRPYARVDAATNRPMVARGFWVAAALNDSDLVSDDRRINPSVRGYSLGSRDLQGKRGNTLIDDIETAEEAGSEALQTRLERRISAVLRTLQDKADVVWAMFGTPYHANSIYFQIPKRLEGSGHRYKVIRLPYRDEETGEALWPDRARKIDIHRLTMSPTEFQVAYLLKPLESSRLSAEEVVGALEQTLPDCPTQEAFRTWFRLTQHKLLSSEVGQVITPNEAIHRIEMESSKILFAVGWDPAPVGDWGVTLSAHYKSYSWYLETHREAGDSWNQITLIMDIVERFPAAFVVVEQNAQQTIFRELLQERLPKTSIVRHYTSASVNSDRVGVPAFIQDLRDGRVRLAAGDEVARSKIQAIYQELMNYTPTGHPHVIPAAWFCWFWLRRHRALDTEKPAEGTVPKAVNLPDPMQPRSIPVRQPVPSRRQRAWRSGRSWTR